MFDKDTEDFLVVFGLDSEEAFWCTEQDVRNDRLGCDGQPVQPSATESCDGTPPGYKVAGLARARSTGTSLLLVEASTPRGYNDNRFGRPSYRLCGKLGRLQEVLIR